jgi:hypothetical protein
MTPTFSLKKRVKDDLFTPDEIGNYTLNLQINQNLFRICITNTNRCLLMEDYTLDNALYPDQLISQLEAIYDHHEVLMAGFWKNIKLAIKDIDFSLIPKSLFDQQFSKEYLKINTGQESNGEHEIFHYAQKSTDAISVFSADKKIIDWFKNQYSSHNITFLHHTTAFIEGVLYSSDTNTDKDVFAQIEDDSLTIIVKSEIGLEFCNSFRISTSDDLVYFILLVYNQLQLSPEKNKLILFGDIRPDSSTYKKLYTYIRHIKFGDKPSSIKFGYKFDEIFDHRYFDLYSMHFCQ